jgi:hypothetical protein
LTLIIQPPSYGLPLTCVAKKKEPAYMSYHTSIDNEGFAHRVPNYHKLKLTNAGFS